MEQEGIYGGKKSTLFRDIDSNLRYIISKVLNIYVLESVYFRFLTNLFRLLEHCRQNLIKVI
jgi:hypothetical protein